MLGTAQDSVTLLLARGRVGLVDAALVRWLRRQRACAQCLQVHFTGSIFAPLAPREHVEEFLAALEAVDGVLRDDLAGILLKSRPSVAVIPLPESDLLRCTLAQICKQEPDLYQINKLLQSTTRTIHPDQENVG